MRLIDVVTAGLEPRWPLHHGIGKMPRKAVVTETRLDGHGTNLPKMAPRRMLARSSLGKPPKRFVSGSRTRLGSASALLRGAEIV